MGSQKTLKSYAQWRLEENISQYVFYRKRFERLLLTMFEWGGLPDGISQRFLESTLFENGLVIFFKSKMGFYVISKATAIGLNDYDEPIGYRAFSAGGINELVKAEDCVVIWNDYFRQPNVENVNFFAKKLSNIDKTIDINLENMKNPYIISCSEGMKSTVEAVMEKKTNGVPYIFVSEEYGRGVDVNVFNLKIDDYTPSLQNLKKEIINEALTFFGINNVNVIKKERLVSGEASQNDEQILLSRNAMFKSRQEGAQRIKEKFGFDVTVNISTMLQETLDELLGGVA